MRSKIGPNILRIFELVNSPNKLAFFEYIFTQAKEEGFKGGLEELFSVEGVIPELEQIGREHGPFLQLGIGLFLILAGMMEIPFFTCGKDVLITLSKQIHRSIGLKPNPHLYAEKGGVLLGGVNLLESDLSGKGEKYLERLQKDYGEDAERFALTLRNWVKGALELAQVEVEASIAVEEFNRFYWGELPDRTRQILTLTMNFIITQLIILHPEEEIKEDHLEHIIKTRLSGQWEPSRPIYGVGFGKEPYMTIH